MGKTGNFFTSITGIWEVFGHESDPYDPCVRVHQTFFSTINNSGYKNETRIIRYDLINRSSPEAIFIGTDNIASGQEPGFQDLMTISSDKIEIKTNNNLKEQFLLNDTQISGSDNTPVRCVTDKGLVLYLGAMLWWYSQDTDVDLIKLVSYNPSWPVDAELAGRYIMDLCGDTINRVEHYGSTSIPGMPAKPVIDLLVEVKSLLKAITLLLPVISRTKNLELWWYGGHYVLIKRDEKTRIRTHHFHLATKQHRIWQGLKFRDLLRTNPDMAGAYADLKLKLAEEYYYDRERYTMEKSDFIRKILYSG